MILILEGNTPSKKNKRGFVIRNGRPISFPNKLYLRWKNALKDNLKGRAKITDIEAVTIVFYSETRRVGDLTNKADSVMDVLVEFGIIDDDNWAIIPQLHLLFGGVDREKPRAEVLISQKV